MLYFHDKLLEVTNVIKECSSSISANDKPALDPVAIAATIDEKYFNTVVSELNDHVVRMGIMTEPYHWHYHPNSDETFIGVEGVVIVETAEDVFELAAGMIVTIPKGVAHTTRPQGIRSVNLTIERADMETVFTGA